MSRGLTAVLALLTLGPLLGGVGGFVLGKHRASDAQPNQPVRSDPSISNEIGSMQPSPARSVEHVPAVVVAKDDWLVTASGSTRLLSLDVEAGDVVQAGETTGTLDVRTLEADLSSKRAALESARARLTRARAALSSAQKTASRLEKLEQFVAAEETELAQSQQQQAAAGVQSERKEVDRLAAEVKRARIAVDDAQLVAPANGIVAATYARVGERLDVGTKILRIVGPQRLVRFALEPSRRADLERDDILEFEVDDDGTVFDVRVSRVARDVDVASRMVFVEAQFVDAQTLAPGRVGRVLLPAAEPGPTVAVHER